MRAHCPLQPLLCISPGLTVHCSHCAASHQGSLSTAATALHLTRAHCPLQPLLCISPALHTQDKVVKYQLWHPGYTEAGCRVGSWLGPVRMLPGRPMKSSFGGHMRSVKKERKGGGGRITHTHTHTHTHTLDEWSRLQQVLMSKSKLQLLYIHTYIYTHTFDEWSKAPTSRLQLCFFSHSLYIPAKPFKQYKITMWLHSIFPLVNDYEKAVCSLIPLHEKHYIVHVKEKEKKTNYSQEPTYVFN